MTARKPRPPKTPSSWSEPTKVPAPAEQEQGAERRDRVKRIKVAVSPTERAEIERRAELANLSVSGYLRAAGLNQPIRSVLDYQAVLELAQVAGDLGRLGGLLKLWLAEQRGKGASVADVNRVLRETRELQDQMRTLMGRV
ncbi:MAG: conjugal transfer protein TraJ [Burkholderiales bacterium]|uniref:plasmid mobilization protein n=1 Tax=Dokdonella sp. TaxID=2291710 RepID=UPI0027B91B4D|nr:hypothetical protein [Dokdonella sp.]MCZ2135865.1 conjugal transfer protein TraJ [Burkholderiales bacterium]